MSNLSERLRALAETLDGCEWNHPLCSASHCRKAADAIERLQAKLEKSAREESTALTQVEKYSIENGRLVAENKRLIGHLAEPAEVRAAAMECSLRVVEHELDQTRAKLADALRLSPAEFQRLRKEKDAEIERLNVILAHYEEEAVMPDEIDRIEAAAVAAYRADPNKERDDACDRIEAARRAESSANEAGERDA